MELWQLWLLFTVPAIAIFVSVISVSIVFIGTILLLFLGSKLCYDKASKQCDDVPETKALLKFLVPTYSVFCVIALLSALVPTKDDAMKIVGGYYITNIENIDNLPPNIVKAVNKFIEEYLEDE